MSLIAESTFSIGFAHLSRLEGSAAFPHFDEAQGLCQRSGDRFLESITRTYAAPSRRLAGEVDGAETLSKVALEFGSEAMTPSYVAVLEGCLAWVALRRAVDAPEDARVILQNKANVRLAKVSELCPIPA